MKIRIPLMVQDPRASKLEGIKATEGFDPDQDEFYLDGPVTKRVAVLDFSPKTGKLLKGAYFRPPKPGQVRGWYARKRTGKSVRGNNLYYAKGKELYTPQFMQVSTFATVLKTMYLFEWEKEGEMEELLGRPLTWAFDAPQLFVIPRAGEQANAFYHRDSHSLQFFYFRSPTDRRKMIYTCLSRDIVAHETGHAIVDGIAPDLLDACTPQSLAIHEAIADLTALLLAFTSHTLRDAVLRKTKGSIDVETTAFSTIAEEVGTEIQNTGKCLRNLNNNKSFNPEDEDNFVPGDEPHDLSEVLSGALFKVMINIHEDRKSELSKTPKYANYEDPLFSASGEALLSGAKRFRRMIFRALDYLAPGDVTFLDFGRAIIAADQIAYPNDNKMRDWICAEFVKRHIVGDADELQIQMNFGLGIIKDEVSTLYSSDWAAYNFANEHRELFCIPSPGVGQKPVPFHVHPRLSVRKKYYDKHPSGKIGHECIFKVSWDHEEENNIGVRYGQTRQVTVGTTLVFDWKTRKILVRLTSAPPTDYTLKCQFLDSKQRHTARDEYEKQRQARDRFLSRLVDEGILKVGKHALDPNGQLLLSAVQAEVSGGKMRTRGTANMLHIIGRGGGL
jgi:hypothetical protein